VPPPPASPGPRPGGTAPATGASCEDHRVTWKNLEKPGKTHMKNVG